MENIIIDPPCPPVLVAWNVLEPKCRANDFDRTLKAEVRDACWMLAQQWRWGEFFGEDGGSIVCTRLSIKNTQVNRYAHGLNNLEYVPFSGQIPLETMVERETIQPDLALQLEMGRHWLKLLDRAFQSESLTLSNFTFAQDYITLYPFDVPQAPTVPPQTEIERQLLVDYCLLAGNDTFWPALQAASGRAINGWKLIQAIQNGTALNDGIFTGFSSTDPERKAFDKAAQQFSDWWNRTYAQPIQTDKAWNPGHLEYQFSCAAPKPGQTAQKIELLADEHHGGTLDWYAFDFPDGGIIRTATDATGETFNDKVTSKEVVTLLPSKITFPGMPNARHWEMEDHAVDFGHLLMNSTDLAKIILQEFMLQYANDWYLIPYQAPVGSLIDLEGIEVKDVFGIRTLVEAANKSNGSGWKRWSMYTLETRNHPNEVDTRFFLAPTLPNLLESKPLEKVNFIRDEMANMVWGVENTIPDGLGSGRDGYEAGLELQRFLRAQIKADEIVEPEVDNAAKIKYVLATTVPENWIPFVPIQIGSANRSVRLQRAAMPRGVKTLSTPVVRPLTTLIREGINNTSVNPYYIEEEEVPKSGTLITQTWQRARWFGGRVFTWLGRQRQTGRGGGYSGLQFDQLKYKETQSGA